MGNRLAQALLDDKFLSVYSTTEKIGGQMRLVVRGKPHTWDQNNGISVVCDEEGRPWIKRDPIKISIFDDAGGTGPQLIRGAHVPHSNDGGEFVRQMLDPLCGPISKQDLTEVRKTAGLMLVIEKMMINFRDIDEYMAGYLKVPADERRGVNDRIFKLYELAKKIHYAKKEAELREALREIAGEGPLENP